VSPEAYLASCAVDTRDSCQNLQLTAHVHLVLKLKMTGAIPPLLFASSLPLCLIDYGQYSYTFTYSYMEEFYINQSNLNMLNALHDIQKRTKVLISLDTKQIVVYTEIFCVS
jgi:hypothetical protein